MPQAVFGVPHRQVVFTVPKRLRIFFRFDPLYDRGHSRKLLGELPGCAWRALRLYFAACFSGVGVVPSAVGFVQTAGELLGWHPHLHVLLTDGGWLPDGTFRHLLAFDSSTVEKLFRAAVPQPYWGLSTAPGPGVRTPAASRWPAATSSSFSLGCSITCRTRANSCCATGAGTAMPRGGGASASRANRAPSPARARLLLTAKAGSGA